MCIKWFQELEGDLLLEQEKHWKMLDSAEKKCNDMSIFITIISRIVFINYLTMICDLF